MVLAIKSDRPRSRKLKAIANSQFNATKQVHQPLTEYVYKADTTKYVHKAGTPITD